MNIFAANADSSSAALGGVIFVFAFFGLWLAAIVFWILKLVEVCKIPDVQYKAGGTDKITWVLVVVLAGVIGGLIWQLSSRARVLAFAGAIGQPAASMVPAGWYPDQSRPGLLRWWDGTTWSEHTSEAPR